MLERPPVSCKSVVTDVVKTPDGVILVRDPHPAVNQALYLIAYRQRTGGQLGTGLVCHDSKKCPPLVRRSYERRGGFCREEE